MALTFVAGARARAQDGSQAFGTGVTVGSLHYSGGRNDVGLAVALQYSPTDWFTLTAAPGFGWTSYAGASSSGLTDLPLSAGAWHQFDATWSPSVAGSLNGSIALSSGANAVGVGRDILGASASLGAWPTDNLRLNLGVSRPLSANSGNGWVNVESSYTMGALRPTVGFSSEVGTADSAAVLSRSVTAGVAYAVDAPLTLVVDGSHGLTTGAPTWSISVGFGTAFAGVSPVSLGSPMGRMRSVFGSRSQSTNGYGSTNGSRGTCKRAGTC
ncbi:MAG TPA: hypothetical protein VJ867_02690 [Gemmatimonadaceae bacterium]|nr:hypothetical protein [Gemmatimonadaceae bacterium]